MRTSLIVAVCLAACSQQPRAEPLPQPRWSDCEAQAIEDFCPNSTGVIRARVTGLEASEVFRWDKNSTVWLTRARIEGLSVIRGRGPAVTNQLHLSGKMTTINDGPLYLFINDRTVLPTYALDCGGRYWTVPSDGGEPLVQSTYRAGVPGFLQTSEMPGDTITEQSFLARVASCTLAP